MNGDDHFDVTGQVLPSLLEALHEVRSLPAAYATTLQHLLDALDADVAWVSRDRDIVAALGVSRSEAEALRQDPVLADCGRLDLLAVGVGSDMTLYAGRSTRPFDTRDRRTGRAVGRALAVALAGTPSQEQEQAVVEPSQLSTMVQHLCTLVPRIARTEQMQTTLDAITASAVEVIPGSVCGLRLLDPADPSYLITVSTHGVPTTDEPAWERLPIGHGVGGRAVTEVRLVIQRDYSLASDTVPYFRQRRLEVAMSAPVREAHRTIGSLTVGSYEPGRDYSAFEEQALVALAELTSLALTDAQRHREAVEARRSREMLLAEVSHELKTPLSVLLGAVATVRRHAARLTVDERDELLESALARGRDLERLIDQLLQSSRSELAGSSERVRLAQVLEQAVHASTWGAHVEVAPAPADEVVIDVAAVRSIVESLIANAVRHRGEEGLVRVQAALAGDTLRVSVSNPGTLGELEPERVFEPFVRGRDATGHGVGLGLFIARRQARALGGDLEVREAYGQVTFTLALPADG